MEKERTRNGGNQLRRLFLAVFVLTLFCVAMLSMTAFAASPAAKIGSKSYSTLQAAFNAVKRGQTIKLQKNLTIKAGKAITMKRNVKFTLDLNRKTITTGENPSAKGGYLVLKKGTMTLKNGRVAGILDNDGIYVYKGATLIVQNKAVCTNIENKGTVKLQKGKVAYLSNSSTGTVSVTGGSIVAKMDISGKVTIKKVKMTGRIFADQDATLTISGGTFKGDSNYSILYGNGKVTISGGTFSGKASGESSESSGCLIGAYGGTWKIKGGTFKNSKGTVIDISRDANVTISGGIINGGRGSNSAIVCRSNFRMGVPYKGSLQISGGTVKSSNGYVVSTLPPIGWEQLHVKVTVSGGKIQCTSKSSPAVYVGISEELAAGMVSVNHRYITAASGTKVQYKE